MLCTQFLISYLIRLNRWILMSRRSLMTEEIGFSSFLPLFLSGMAVLLYVHRHLILGWLGFRRSSDGS